MGAWAEGYVWVRRLGAVLVVGGLLGGAGCRHAGGPLRHGVVNLSALLPLHPAWARLADLDRKIATLGTSIPPNQTTVFSPPSPARLERVDIEIARIDAAQRLRMSEDIHQRVRREFEAGSARLERQAQRIERAAIATAAAEAEEKIARRSEEFARQYDAAATTYAGKLGTLRIRILDYGLLREDQDREGKRVLRLLPWLVDVAFFPPEQVKQRAEQAAQLLSELQAAQAERDTKLRGMLSAHREQMTELRKEAIDKAVADARAKVTEENAALTLQRQRQQAQLETDLERALRAHPAPEPAPIRDIPSRLQAVAARIGQVNQSAGAELEAQRAAVAAALIELQRQRRELAARIEAATRTAALQVADEQGLALAFDNTRGDPRLTASIAEHLRGAWGTAGSGGQRGPG